MTTPFPEPESPELERFTVYSRAEIALLLRQVLDTGTYVTAYFDADPGFAVTRLLAVDAEFEEVVMEDAADAAVRPRLLDARHITFVAFLDHVKLQFSARRIADAVFDGRGALRIRFPSELLRLQRRDFYRVQPPQEKPAKCLVPYTEAQSGNGNGAHGANGANGHGNDTRRYESLRVVDISVGGLAVLAHPRQFELPIGRIIEDCFIDLPGVGSFAVSLIVRHADPATSEPRTRRCGCEFVDMPPATRVMLQRYINRADGEQRNNHHAPASNPRSGAEPSSAVT